jgi:hypothetical protein
MPAKRTDKQWLRAYDQQRRAAGKRGIGWEFTYPEWRRIWAESGFEHLRGRGRGKYVMARFNDAGPYRANNVVICTCEQNASEAYLHSNALLHQPIGRGWDYLPHRNKSFPYFARYGLNNYIGKFATADEARSCYLEYRAKHLQTLEAQLA